MCPYLQRCNSFCIILVTVYVEYAVSLYARLIICTYSNCVCDVRRGVSGFTFECSVQYVHFRLKQFSVRVLRKVGSSCMPQ